MAKGTWADGAGVAWSSPAGVHWVQDWTVPTALAPIVPTAATINWKNITRPASLGSLVTTTTANINERWRVEPSPIPSSVVAPDATVNWKNYTFTTPLAAIAPLAANINWKNYTFTVAGASLVTTPDAVPVAAYWMTTAVRLDLVTAIDAFIKLGPWAPTGDKSTIEIATEDRVISIQAEDRNVEIPAEDRNIVIKRA
jgi:hypothetical protein